MSIVTSVIASDQPQRDGRRRVHEVHTNHTGSSHSRTYVCDAGFDAAAALAAYAVLLAAELRAFEIARNVDQVKTFGSLAVTTLIHSTGAENFAALRAAYLTMTRTEAIMSGDFLSSLTNPQLMTAFSMTNAQVNTLRTNKLTPAATAAATIRAATGA